MHALVMRVQSVGCFPRPSRNSDSERTRAATCLARALFAQEGTMRRETEEQFIIAVGQRIRKLRSEHGYSLREFGKRSGVHPFHLMAIELGQLAANTRTLRAIANGLDVRLMDLLNTGDDNLEFIVEAMRTNPMALESVRAYATNRVVN
jgi:ribosome-binding protein aMBF1 (putative translation factor)